MHWSNMVKCSYTLHLRCNLSLTVGALFRAKNAGFVDSEWKGSRKSNAQTLKRDLAPANCSRAFAVLEKANLGTASTLAPKKDFVAS